MNEVSRIKIGPVVENCRKEWLQEWKPSNGKERESAGPPTCWSCGEQGHAQRFCKKQKKKKATTSNSPSNSDSSARKALYSGRCRFGLIDRAVV